MTVLVVTHGYPPVAESGSAIYAAAVVQALRIRHHDTVVVLTREADPSRPEYALRRDTVDGVSVIHINNTFRMTRSVAEAWDHSAVGAVARQVIDEVRPDVAHVHHLTCLSTSILEDLRTRGVPIVFTLHDYWLLCSRGQLLDREHAICQHLDPGACQACLGPEAGLGAAAAFAPAARRFVDQVPAARRLTRSLTARVGATPAGLAAVQAYTRARWANMRHAIDCVSLFLAPSQHLRARFVAAGVPSSRIELSPYGFDHAPFARLSRQVSPVLRAGFMGSLMVSKAPHLAIDAVRQLPADRVSLELRGGYADYHGDDSYRRVLESGLADGRVTLAGPVPHASVPETLAALDVLLVPSIWPENSPLVIQEAFLAGVPVVASRIGGIPELVTDRVNGLLVEPDDADDLARALGRLLDEPGLLSRLRQGIPPVRSIEDDVDALRHRFVGLASSSVGRASRPLAAKGRVAAVVLNYRTPDDTLIAVQSLLSSQPALDHVVVIDNDAGGGCDAAVARFPVTYMPMAGNLGFSGGMNAGIVEARRRGADRILFVNSDVVVPPDCVAELNHVLDEHPRAGIVVPIICRRSEPDIVSSLGLSWNPISGRMRNVGDGLRHADLAGRAVQGIDAANGCLMLIRIEVFDRAGVFDEDFFFSFEDLEFSLRARRAGFEVLRAGRAFALHEGARAIGAASSDRLYFAARNHLLAARRSSAAGGLGRTGRAAAIVGFNVLHAIRRGGFRAPQHLAAVARGTLDYARGRFGPP